MWQKIRLVIFAAVLAVAVYFLLSYHIIYFGNSIKLIHKAKPTSEYTFINVVNKSMESIMRIDTLREAGIGDILVEMGIMSKKEKEYFEQEFKSDPVYY
ncbi:MAG: hypothetical protein KKH68_01470 [Proteobacteria bacterium]|nr:hypothetical protein [Pseudomonadota bacterium]